MPNTHLTSGRSRRTGGLAASPRKGRGLTLMEVIVATALVGLILVGALNGLGGALKMWVVAERRAVAYSLAEQLMSEIMQHEYKESGSSTIGIDASPESPTVRTDWDDVDDYNGWSQAPEDKDGTALAAYAAWTRAVQVDWVNRNDPNTTTGTDLGLKRITVTVTDPDGQTTELVAWRSQYGMLETPPEADTSVQSWVRNTMTVDGSSPLPGGTALLNKAE